MYEIPLFKLNYDLEEENAVISTLKSKWISTGPKCAEFERLFEELIGVKHAIALSSCTDALHLANYSLGVGPGDEVICPSLTFAATVNSIIYVGAKPVFCDIKSYSDLTIDPNQIESLISNRTRAVIVMDYAGFPCDMDPILSIADKYNLKVIEDSCHGPMSEYKGRCIGTIGDVGCFSFFSNKNVSTGEGGMLTTNRDDLYDKCKSLRSHGMSTMSYQRATGHATEYDICEVGFNYRLDDIRASLGIVQLNKLKADLIKRQGVRKMYETSLSCLDEVIIPFSDNKEFVSNYIMPIVLKDSSKIKRDFVRNYLHEKGIQTSIHYPAVHKFSVYKQYTRTLPITEYVVDNEISLPMYSTLKDNEVVYICESIRKALDKWNSTVTNTK
ncbi:MAG: DegT/DnrJ/EryC1/StrS family aminotransferase [Pseudobutyrivibrio ruminis]|nr:DegT/DnrJ/EryC1/StrS family aminotransferase [Pseudobutyrivibrio ruminis]